MSNSVVAVPQDKPWLAIAEWMRRHEMLVARKESMKDTPVVFLGDSITEGWLGTGKASWDRYFAPIRALNLGIGGDETQHILWRIDRGALDGISPKALVLLIGTNNIGNSGMNGTDSAKGVRRVLDAVRAKLPSTRILLLAVFPRDENPGTPFRREVQTLNREIALLADGRDVRLIDYAGLFQKPDGTLPQSLFPDFLHLSPEAYEIWARELVKDINEASDCD